MSQINLIVNIIIERVVGYIELIMAGLGGFPHMIACTLLALRHIVFHFKGNYYIVTSIVSFNCCYFVHLLMYLKLYSFRNKISGR